MTFRRALLIVLGVLVVAPFAAALWLVHTESGARFAWRQVEAALDGALAADSVGGTFARGLRIEGLGYRDDAVQLDVDTATLRVGIGITPLTVAVGDARVNGVRLRLSPSAEPESDTDASSFTALDQLALPLVLRIDDLLVSDIQIERGDGLRTAVDSLSLSGRWQDAATATLHIEAPAGVLDLSGTLGFRPPYAIDAETTARLTGATPLSATLSVTGRINDYALTANAETVLDAYGALTVDVTGEGTLEDFDIGEARATTEQLALRSSGRVEWSDEPTVTMAVNVVRADLSRFVAAWPAGHPLGGRFDVVLSPGGLAIDNARITVAGTTASVSGGAAIDIEAQTLAGQLEWNELGWPIDPEGRQISSPDGELRLTGSLDAWSVAGAIAVDAPDVSPERFEIAAEGGRTSARFRIADAGVLGGRLSGNGMLAWSDEGLWSVSVDFDDIRTGALLPALPGRLSGRVDAEGSAEPLAFEAALDGVRGELAGQPVAAAGRVDFRNGDLSVSNLRVRHGTSEVTLNGSPYTRTGLVFSAHVSDLSAYAAEAEGELRAAGRAGLREGIPWLSMTAASERLRLGELEVLGFRIDDLAPDVDTRSRLKVSADEISMRGQQVLAPRVELNVTPASQSLLVDIGYEGLRLKSRIRGALDSWSEPAAWQGELDTLEFDFAGHPPVELSNPASLRIADGQVLLERLCLREPGGAALCAAAGWRKGGRTDVSATLSSMPLQMVNALTDTGFVFDQTLSGEFEWHSEPAAPPTGRARIVASPGLIRDAGRRNATFETAESTLEFNIVDGRLLSGKLNLPMPGTGIVTGAVSVLDVANPLDSELAGNVAVSLGDIGAFSALTPLIDEASGEIEGQVDIAGRLGELLLTGRVEFTNGGLSYDPLGLTLSDINVTGELDGDRGIEIEGTFVNGDGRGRIHSRHEDGFQGGLEVFISGTGLRLIDVPDVTATADIDLGVGLAGDALNIEGRIVVPQARISPTTLPASRDVASGDAVVVRGELPGQDDEEAQSALRITGSLDVELGEGVTIDLGIARASIVGRTVFTWTGEPIPTAEGRYDMRGQIQAFGQVLTIADGGVRFPGISAANPQLRLRAEREIYGNSQVKTAGVLVSGTVAKPKIEAYTDPMTTEERALTLLVTGSDFDLEQGVGAVDFGTYIAPRLFVSYGIGIFDRDNVISARYDLTQGFGVRATSGQRESGVDAIYRFER